MDKWAAGADGQGMDLSGQSACLTCTVSFLGLIPNPTQNMAASTQSCNHCTWEVGVGGPEVHSNL